jgi:hypothetical protein
MSQYLTYKEDKTTPNIYVNDPGISWANTTVSAIPYTMYTTNNLSKTITLDNSSDTAINAAKLEPTIGDSITAAIKPKEKKAYAAVKLDNSSDEGGYSCLAAYVPQKTE